MSAKLRKHWQRSVVVAGAVGLPMMLMMAFHAGSAQQVQSNLVSNPGFEEERSGLPTGWSLDDSLKSKGSARLDKSANAGQRSLELSPNRNNTDPGHLYGFGQLIPARDIAGKRVRLQVAVRTAGGATATAVAFAVAAGFKPLNNIALEQGQPTADFQMLSESFEVDRDAVQVLIACAVKGVNGKAWFDDVSFGVDGGAAPSSSAPSGNSADASVAIDASQVLRPVPRNLFGSNIEWINDGNGMWDSAQQRLKSEILAAAKDLGVSLVRFPGGIFADYYHWRDGVGPAAQRPTRPHMADDGKSRHTFGTDELMQFCRLTGAQPMMQVNIVTGTPEEAAEWVAYCNRPDHPERTRNGSRQPYNVHYWEIGNEPYGKSDNKQIAASSLTPQEYARRFLAFSAAMKRADPSIAVGAVGGYNSGKYLAVSDNNWNRVVLEATGSKMDFLAIHNAYAPLWASASGGSFEDVYRALLAFPRLISQNLDEVAQQVRTYSGGAANPVQLAITEWGPLFHILPSDPWVDHPKTMGSALFVASAMQAFLRSERTSIANFFKLSDATFMGWIDSHGNPKPNYYALQMYTRHFGSDIVRADGSGPRFRSRPIGNVAAIDDAPALDAIASVSADRKYLYAIVVNRLTTAAVRTNISIRGFKPKPTGRGWILTAPSLDSNNGVDLPAVPGLHWAKQMEAPKGAMFSRGTPGFVSPREIALTQVSGAFTHTFPPISITAIELAQ